MFSNDMVADGGNCVFLRSSVAVVVLVFFYLSILLIFLPGISFRANDFWLQMGDWDEKERGGDV
jgi:hypothetical protein